MSDFIFSNQWLEKGKLTKEIHSIYHEDFPEVEEFVGDWGTLAISRNLYRGFQVFENSGYLCAVIGGPVLFFRNNSFLVQGLDIEGTEAVLERWLKGQMNWDDDLSGPFVVLIIDKTSSEIRCVTDILSYIPVYIYKDSQSFMLSTHSDALARVSKQQLNVDVVSKVDFILHGVVCYPYTVYRNISQIPPASIHLVQPESNNLISEFYWVPEESGGYKSIYKAGEDLDKALQSYVLKTTEGMTHIAQFISGGEDSRVLSAVLPNRLEREAFVFLDSMNREGILAKKAAEAYGAHFNLQTRNKEFYLEILPAAVNMIGDGGEFIHAHTLNLYKSSKLRDYPAVFGGFCSDTLLKGACIDKARGIRHFPFIPEVKRKKKLRKQDVNNPVFKKEILKEVAKRREAHLNFVKTYRKNSAEEWFELWPFSLIDAGTNVQVNRRLFRIYEPFMANEIVKIASITPQHWKLNRRLFYKMAKPYLKKTKWLMHSDGRLPYFPWYVNSFLQVGTWGYQQLSKRIGLVKEFQGPWGEWKWLFESGEFQKYIDKYQDGFRLMDNAFTEKNIDNVLRSFNMNQRFGLLQTLYSNQKILMKIEEESVQEQQEISSSLLSSRSRDI